MAKKQVFVDQLREHVNNQTGTSYTLAASDWGGLVTLSNGSAIAITLDSTLGTGFFGAIENIGVGTATLTPSSGTINGAANMPLATNAGCWLFFNGTNWYAVTGSSSGGGLNGVVVKTTNYTALGADNGILIVFNSGSAIQLTLPPSPPTATWCVFTENIGAGVLTVNRNGLNIDGAASNLTVPQNRGLYISTDGSNYFTERGLGAPSPLTTKGDIWGFSTVDARIPVGTNGQQIQADSTQTLGLKWVSEPFDLGFQLSNIPPLNTRYLVWEFTRVVAFPANFSGAQGKCLSVPTNPSVFTVEKNGATVGTVSIAATGVFTFATTGGATVTYNIGDWLSVITPNPQDLTLSDVGFVLPGTR